MARVICDVITLLLIMGIYLTRPEGFERIEWCVIAFGGCIIHYLSWLRRELKEATECKKS